MLLKDLYCNYCNMLHPMTLLFFINIACFPQFLQSLLSVKLPSSETAHNEPIFLFLYLFSVRFLNWFERNKANSCKSTQYIRLKERTAIESYYIVVMTA